MELCNLINHAAELANSIELLYSSSSARSPHHLEFYAVSYTHLTLPTILLV